MLNKYLDHSPNHPFFKYIQSKFRETNIIKQGNANNTDTDTETDDQHYLYFELNDFTLPRTPNEKYNNSRIKENSAILRFEEIMAMILEHADNISDKYGSTDFTEAVYTIQPWWNPVDRELVMSAA